MTVQTVRTPCSLCGGILVIRVTHDGWLPKVAIAGHHCRAPQEDTP